MKRLVAAAAFAAFATSAASIAGAADLNICVEGAYPPFSEINSEGNVVGFDIDIANALCDMIWWPAGPLSPKFLCANGERCGWLTQALEPARFDLRRLWGLVSSSPESGTVGSWLGAAP